MELEMTTRPVYEKKHDIGNEVSFMKIMASKGCTINRAKKFSGYDFLMTSSKSNYLVEYKKRNNNRLKYTDYMISADKIANGINKANALGCKYYLFVQWDDGLFWIEPSSHSPILGFGGRVDRGDSQDMEVMCYYDTGLFEEVKHDTTT
jgi:hypothetical protein